MIERRFAVPIERVPRQHSTSILTTCAVFLGIAWIIVGLRLWTRAKVVRAVGWDDGWMLVSIVFFTVLCVSASTLTFMIDERTILSETLMTLAINLLLVAEVFYVLTMMALKAALALFFLRIIVEPWQRRTIYINLTLSTLFGMAYAFYAIFQCGIPHGTSFWVNKLSGKCVGTSSILGLGYTHALVNALTDLTFVALSIPMLRKVRINHREKVIVGGIFFLASVGSIASFIRLPYVKALAVSDLGFFKNLLWLVIWSTVEPGLGITAASLATLRPLLRKLESQLSSFTSSQSRSGSHSNRSEASLAPKPGSRARSQSEGSRSRNRLQKSQKEKMNIGPDTATSTMQSSTIDSIWKESGSNFQSKDRIDSEEQRQQQETAWPLRPAIRPSQQQQQHYQHERQSSYPQQHQHQRQPSYPQPRYPQQQQQNLHPIQQRNLQQRHEEEQYKLGQPEDNWYPRPTTQPGHILVSGETTTDQRIVIKNNPFRFGRRKKSKDSSDQSSSSPSAAPQRQRQEEMGEKDRERDLPEEERGVLKNSPWKPTPRKKKGGSWLPLALFGSKSSLDRFATDSDGESGVDPQGAMQRGRVRDV